MFLSSSACGRKVGWIPTKTYKNGYRRIQVSAITDLALVVLCWVDLQLACRIASTLCCQEGDVAEMSIGAGSWVSCIEC